MGAVFVGEYLPTTSTGAKVVELERFGLLQQHCNDLDEAITASGVRTDPGEFVCLSDTDPASAPDTPGTVSSSFASRRHCDASAVEQFSVARVSSVDDMQLAGFGSGDRHRLFSDHTPSMDLELADPLVEEPVIQVGEVLDDCHRHVSIIQNMRLFVNSLSNIRSIHVPRTPRGNIGVRRSASLAASGEREP